MGLHFQRVLVFTLTFVSYAIYHMSRKNLSGVKPNMSHDWLSNDTHENSLSCACLARRCFLDVRDLWEHRRSRRRSSSLHSEGEQAPLLQNG